MRSIYAASLGLFLLASIAQGQPAVSYIIPDIGAEGLNTYVEIIGPTDRPGNFGVDGLYANISGDAVRVVPAATDEGKIVVGPVVVSWDGRLISTQIFVKSGVSYRGPVSLTVIVNGASVTDRSFTIVNPQSLGAAGVLTGGGAIGSGGTFGLRSRRGVMIVDSLTLQGGNFTVSTNDPDGDPSNGNQGYLPFILIARGPIRIDGSTVFNVNAGSPDGGPGGGGGGGNVCDGATGERGGSGFTSGGAGGGRGGGFAAIGMASGAAGGSLNGVPCGGDGRPACSSPQSSGGGTGHPFGSGGSGFCSGAVDAGAGGGAGNGPGAGGGGGGNVVHGKDGGGATYVSGGRAHGNIQGVPVAGGSGGGGGNSIAPGGCGGSGGGGGGAIVLYSMDLFDNNFRVNAAGGNGLGGSGAGGGSGGFVSIGSKVMQSEAGRLYALGGLGSGNGGDGSPGRIRYDGFPLGDPSVSAGSSLYAGPSIDTVSYTDSRLITVSGIGDGSDSIRLYYRRDDTEWALAPPIAYLPGVSRRWSVVVDLPPVEGVYYLMAMQKAAPGGGSPAERQPEWVLSQAAANMVRLRIIPKIDVADTLRFADMTCAQWELDSIAVSNTGDAPLTITPSIIGSSDFAILAPHNAPFSIAPRSSVTMRLRFTPASSGVATATLLLTNDDPRTMAGRPMRDRAIGLIGRRLLVEPRFVPGEVDLGDICLGTTIDTIVQFRYQGDVSGSALSVDGLEAPYILIDPAPVTLPRNLGLDGNVQVRLRFRPDDVGLFHDTVRVRMQPCDTTILLPVRGRVVSPKVAISPAVLAFGDAPVSGSIAVPVTLVNRDSIPVTIANTWFDPSTPDLAIDASIIGRVLQPGETRQVNATWRPTALGDLRTTRLCFTLAGVCNAQRCIDITGRGVRSRLQATPARLVLAADSCLDDPVEDIADRVVLRNNGTAAEPIIGFTTSAAGVVVTSAPVITPGYALAPGDSIVFTIVWTPGLHGVATDQITITTGTSQSGGEPTTIALELRRNLSSLAIVDTAGVDLPRELEFAPDFQCMGPQVRRLLLANRGTLDEVVNLQFANRTAFSVTPVTPITLAAGSASSGITVRFDPGAPGEYYDTLIAVTRSCSRQVRIPVRGTRHAFAYAVSAITFGPSRAGLESRRSATLSNTGAGPNNARISVSRAYIKQTGALFAIVSSNLPASLAPGEVGSVEVSFSPVSQGSYTAELCYVIDAPCPQEICVPIGGSGSLASVIVQNRTLNYGSRLHCEDSTLSVVIENIGGSPYLLRDVRLEGVDAGAFQQGTSLTYPYAIPGGGSLTIPYRFIPGRALHDGLNSARLVVVTDDPLDTAIVIDLIGERRRQMRPTPSRLDFGLVEVTTTGEKRLVLENRTDHSVVIDRLTIDPPFEVVSPTGSVVVPPWDSVLVVVRMSASDTSSQISELVAWQSSPCIDTTVVPTTAQGGIVAVGVASIGLGHDVTARPGRTLSIPIIVETGRDLAPAQARSFRATVRVRRSALLLKGARARWELDTTISALGGIAATTYTIRNDGESRLIEFTMANPATPSVGDTLGFVDAVALLGDSVTTRTIIDTLVWTDGRVRVTRRNGQFILGGICTVGGDRLVEVSGLFGIKQALPNPFNPSTEIIFETVTDEPTWLMIYDGRGNPVQRLVDGEGLAIGAHLRRWDASGFPSGLYYAVLITPARRSMQPLLLVK